MQHTRILSFPLPSLSAFLPLPFPHTDKDTRACMHTQSHVHLVSDSHSHTCTTQWYTYTIIPAHMVYSIHMPVHIDIHLHTRSHTKVCHLECVWSLLKCKKRTFADILLMKETNQSNQNQQTKKINSQQFPHSFRFKNRVICDSGGRTGCPLIRSVTRLFQSWVRHFTPNCSWF